jgi:hypothetical protein
MVGGPKVDRHSLADWQVPDTLGTRGKDKREVVWGEAGASQTGVFPSWSLGTRTYLVLDNAERYLPKVLLILQAGEG